MIKKIADVFTKAVKKPNTDFLSSFFNRQGNVLLNKHLRPLSLFDIVLYTHTYDKKMLLYTSCSKSNVAPWKKNENPICNERVIIVKEICLQFKNDTTY